MQDIVIQLSGVSKYYKLYSNPRDRIKEVFHPLKRKYHTKHHVLNNVDLQLRKGEILGVVGKNGSGKSTLLKIIASIIKPVSGSVIVDGTVSALVELGGGFNGEFTGMQNIYFLATMQGFTHTRIDDRIAEIVEFADIGEYINQPVKSYSSGMKARLSFSIAVHIDPEILILDEVFAVGDELFRRKCYSKMEELFRNRKTIVYVSHDANSIMELCTRAVLLESSEILLDSDPKTVVTYYQKLLYAKKDNKGLVTEEIRSLNNTGSIAGNAVEKTNGVRSAPTNVDCYIPELKPTSTVEYKNHDVEFLETTIQSKRNQKTNVLITGQEYQFRVRVRFGIDMSNIGFSFAIKNEKGMDISTFRTLRNQFSTAKSADEFEVIWRFSNGLMPGIYYLNVGARSYPDNGESFVLNRVIDVDAFKVVKQGANNFGGLVSLGQIMTVTKVN